MLRKSIILCISLFLITVGLYGGNYWWGNGYLMNDSKEIGNYDATAVISNNNRKLAFRFTSPIDTTVNKVKIYVGVVQGGPPALKYKVETADASGKPSGNLVDANAVGTYAATSTGSKTVSFNGSFALQKNNIYFLVIQTNGGNPVDGSNYYDLRVSVPLNDFFYYDGEAKKVDDGSFNVFASSNNGQTWRLENYSPLFVFMNSSTYVLGTPFYSKSTIYIKNSTTKVEQVILSPKDLTIDMIQLYVNNTGTPGILKFSIDEVTNLNNTGIKSNLITGEFGADATGWVLSGLDYPVVMASNMTYMISFDAVGVDSVNYYKILGEKGWDADFTWYGTNSYVLTNGVDFYSTKRADIPVLLHIVDTNSTSGGSGGTTVTTQFTTNSQTVYITNNNTDTGLQPSESKVYSAYPNVFDSGSDSKVDIMFDVKENSQVSISVYNINGEKVAVLMDSYLDSGRYKISWGGSIGEFNARASSVDSEPAIVGSSGNKIKRGIYLIVIKMNDKIIRNKFFVR